MNDSQYPRVDHDCQENICSPLEQLKSFPTEAVRQKIQSTLPIAMQDKVEKMELHFMTVSISFKS